MVELDSDTTVCPQLCRLMASVYEAEFNSYNLKESFARPRVHLTPNIVILFWALPVTMQHVDTFELLNMLRAMRMAWCTYFNPMIGFYPTSTGTIDRLTQPNDETIKFRETMRRNNMIPALDMTKVNTLDDLDRETRTALDAMFKLSQEKRALYDAWPVEPTDDFIGEFPRPYDRCYFFLEFEAALVRYCSDLFRIEFVDNPSEDACINWYVRCMEWLALKVLLLGKWIDARRAGQTLPTLEERFARMVEVTPYYDVQHPVFSGLQRSTRWFDDQQRNDVLKEKTRVYERAYKPNASSSKKRVRDEA